jgi:hypothetical protein
MLVQEQSCRVGVQQGLDLETRRWEGGGVTICRAATHPMCSASYVSTDDETVTTLQRSAGGKAGTSSS